MNEKILVRVSDVMRDNFTVIDGFATVKDALDKMVETNSRTLIVDKRDKDDEFGIILLSDIAKKVLAKDKAPDRVNTYEIMTKPVIAVKPEMDVRYCARFFDNLGISIAPVIKEDKVIGMVGYHELVLKGLLPNC
ncbi:MAG: CBS domain-containing protein [Pseudomonadales bacterium]